MGRHRYPQAARGHLIHERPVSHRVESEADVCSLGNTWPGTRALQGPLEAGQSGLKPVHSPCVPQARLLRWEGELLDGGEVLSPGSTYRETEKQRFAASHMGQNEGTWQETSRSQASLFPSNPRASVSGGSPQERRSTARATSLCTRWMAKTTR